MKLLGSTDDGGGRGPPGRSQDDAAIGYGFQRQPNEPEFPHFPHKQHRWAIGDDIIDVSIISSLETFETLCQHSSIFLYSKVSCFKVRKDIGFIRKIKLINNSNILSLTIYYRLAQM